MSLEFVPPKYAQLVSALKRRIEDGSYPAGSAMPSEVQLQQEFRVSRPTVVRALGELRSQGWIDSQQGKGRYVRGRPVLAELETSRPSQRFLDDAEHEVAADIVVAGIHPVPARVAVLLDIEAASKAFVRRRLLYRDGEACELVSAWLPLEIAEGTDLASGQPLPEGLRQHLEDRKGVSFDHVIEHITARGPTDEEARQLQPMDGTPLLVVYAVVREPSGHPLLVLEIVLPADRHELEDAYPLS